MRKPWIIYLALGHFIISASLTFVWFDQFFLMEKMKVESHLPEGLGKFLETMISILWFPLYQMMADSFYFNLRFETVGLFLSAVAGVSFLWAILLYSFGLIVSRFMKRKNL